MESRRRQRAERCSTNTRWQELGRNLRAAAGPNEKAMRWHDALDPSIDRANGRTGKWAEDEDIKLKDAVQTHGGKDWAAIAALVPGRTRKQCCRRWNNVFDPQPNASATREGGMWTRGEESKLTRAIHKTHKRNRTENKTQQTQQTHCHTQSPTPITQHDIH